MRASLATSLAALLWALAPGLVHAQGAPADTTVEGYVRAMADSTDLWFGLSAGTVDTTGIDSTRAYRLAHPGDVRGNKLRLGLEPRLGFNRVYGPILGGALTYGPAWRWGRFSTDAEWASGPNRWLGGGAYEIRRGDDDDWSEWRLRLRAGRDAAMLDRDDEARALSTLRAFIAGSDHAHYDRQDGAKLEFSRRSPAWGAGLTLRDQLESPMATTATWYLTGHEPQVVANDSAARVRVHESGAWARWRLPHSTWSLTARGWRAGGGLGGDASYARLRASFGGPQAIGRHLTLMTQTDYGRLTGDVLPQDAFYTGGVTLNTLEPNALRGSGRALARTELMLVDPLQRVLRLDRNPTFPLQLGVFAGTAATWGRDPLTGRAVATTRDWAERREWLSEAGVSLLYRPGLPDPSSFVRVAFAWPLGPGARDAAVYVSYTRALSLVVGR